MSTKGDADCFQMILQFIVEKKKETPYITIGFGDAMRVLSMSRADDGTVTIDLLDLAKKKPQSWYTRVKKPPAPSVKTRRPRGE